MLFSSLKLVFAQVYYQLLFAFFKFLSRICLITYFSDS